MLLALGLHVSVTVEVSEGFALARETNTETIVGTEIQQGL
jgi:hypothetical protein